MTCKNPGILSSFTRHSSSYKLRLVKVSISRLVAPELPELVLSILYQKVIVYTAPAYTVSCYTTTEYDTVYPRDGGSNDKTQIRSSKEKTVRA